MRQHTPEHKARSTVELLKGLGELYRRGGQVQRGLVMLLIAVHVAPEDPGLLRRLIIAFTETGQSDRALSALDRLTQIEGESEDLMLLRSRALWRAGRIEDARACFIGYLSARRASA
nr:tetratricopeptide repeat protein [uncultured Pseudomonas sp.]